MQTRPKETERGFDRIELVNHRARSRVAIGEWTSILFGLVMLLLGSIPVAAAFDLISGRMAPPWLLVTVGCLFASVGLLLLSRGVREFVRVQRRDRLFARNPREPWFADYPWVASGIKDDSTGAFVNNLVFIGFLALFLAPFNYIAFFSGGTWVDRIGFELIVSVFDLIGLVAIGYLLYVLARAFKYGRSSLQFGSFPFFLGQRLEARLFVSRPIETPDGLKCTLRCVEEAYEVRGTGESRARQVVCYERYSDSKVSHAATGTAGLPISFELPVCDLATTLSSIPPRYWEIEVCAETPCVDYSASFLLPVYKPPR